MTGRMVCVSSRETGTAREAPVALLRYIAIAAHEPARKEDVVVGTSSLARSLRIPCSILLAAIAWLCLFAIQLPQRSEAQSSSVHVRTTSRPRGVWLQPLRFCCV